MNLAPSFGVTAADYPRPAMEDAFCPHCGSHAVPRKKAGAWTKAKAVLWDAEHPMTLEEIAMAAGVEKDALAAALVRHRRQLTRKGTARLYVYRLRWRA